MSKAEEALKLVEALALCITPEEDFGDNQNEDGVVVVDGVEYVDVDEMIADIGGDELMDKYGEFMDFVRQAKEICSAKEGSDDRQGQP